MRFRVLTAAGVLALTPALVACQAEAPAPAPAVEEPQLADLDAALTASAAGWNEGDMQRFLAIYSGDPRTSFVTADEVLHGRAEMEERYRTYYDWSRPDPSERGVLTFQSEDFRPLGPDHALWVGRYILSYPEGKPPATGFTSLVFAREDGEWRIIADHSN